MRNKNSIKFLELWLMLLVVVVLGYYTVPKFAEVQNILTANHFPDPVFRKAVKERLFKNHEYRVTRKDAQKVYGVSVNFYNYWYHRELSEYLANPQKKEIVYSIKGIENFSNLKELNISHFKGEVLDLSNNPKLKTLRCTFSTFDQIIVHPEAHIVNLELKQCSIKNFEPKDFPHLIKLNLMDNDLKNIDLSKNPYLKDLNCAYNQLTELDLTTNSKLCLLDCRNNEITYLKINDGQPFFYFDVSHNQLSSIPNITFKDQRFVSFNENQFDCDDVKQFESMKKEFYQNFNTRQSSPLGFLYNEQLEVDLSKCQ